MIACLRALRTFAFTSRITMNQTLDAAGWHLAMNVRGLSEVTEVNGASICAEK